MDLRRLEEDLRSVEFYENRRVKKRQIGKFDRLMMEKNRVEEEERIRRDDTITMRREKVKEEVVDLTEEGIDEEVRKYLSLGPDFCESPSRVPYEKMICQTEKMCSTIKGVREGEGVEETEIEKELLEVREASLKILRKYKGSELHSNLTSEEMRGKKKIKLDRDRVYTPADKGRVMVAMDKRDYEQKMGDVLTDLKARPSIRADKDWDLTDKVSRDIRPIIKDMMEKGGIDESKAILIQPSEYHAP